MPSWKQVCCKRGCGRSWEGRSLPRWTILSHLYQRLHSSIIILKPPMEINALLHPVSGSPPFPRLLSSCQTSLFSLHTWGSTGRVGGTQHWQKTGLFCSHSSALRMNSLTLTSLSPPSPSRNFLSPNSIHPLSKTLKAGADSGDKKAVCSHVSSLWQISCSESARWIPGGRTRAARAHFML